LITAGQLPPSPEQIPELLNETFVNAGMLKQKYVKSMRELYLLHKAIAHGHINEIKSQAIDEWQNLSEEFLKEMTRIIDDLLSRHVKE
jgi:uncharacterized protein (UPF0332 family)